MVYDYVCVTCSNIQEEEHSVNGFKEFTPKCVKCGNSCNYKFTPSIPQIAFLDGPSGSFPSKAIRVNKQMTARSNAAAKRQHDRYGEPAKAIPNYKGQIADTWAEARAEAIVKDGHEVASSYNDKVKEENASSKKIIT